MKASDKAVRETLWVIREFRNHFRLHGSVGRAFGC